MGIKDSFFNGLKEGADESLGWCQSWSSCLTQYFIRLQGGQDARSSTSCYYNLALLSGPQFPHLSEEMLPWSQEAEKRWGLEN